ncbi:Cocoonase-like protein, partial [Operophtera brumata]
MFPYQAYLLLQKGIQKAFIRIGSIDSDSGGLEFQSSNFRIHPLYNSQPNDYDIAIIRLQQSMALDGQKTKAVDIPEQNAAIPEGTKFR